jgi:hypothetical protein
VVTSYGNEKYYRIQGLKFDLNTREYKLGGDNEHTLQSYYKDKYNVNIESPKAPLIVPVVRRNQPDTLLVPELLKMTGIPENCDERLRMDISKETIKPPGDKARKLRVLIDKLKAAPSGPQSLRPIGIEFGEEFTRVKARLMPNPVL